MYITSQTPAALACAVLAPVLWGGNFVVGSVIPSDLPGVWTNFLRWLVAMAVVLPFFVRTAWQYRSELMRNWRGLAIQALLGVTLFNTVLYEGLKHAPVSIAAVAFAVTPFATFGLLAVLGRECVSRRKVAAASLAMFGMVLAQWQSFQSGTPAVGVGLVLLAALIWSGYCVSLREFRVSVPNGAVFLCEILLGTIFMLPAVAVKGADGLVALAPRDWLAFFYLGVFAAAAAFFLWQKAVASIGPGGSSLFMNLVPIATLAISAAVGGNSVRDLDLLAIALVLLAIYVSGSHRSTPRAARRV